MNGNETAAVLDAVLSDLDECGVEYDLKDGVFMFRDRLRQLPAAKKQGLMRLRPALTYHLRRRHGLCVACEGEPETANHPTPWGYASRSGTPGGNVRVMVPEHLRKPAQWCDRCWHSGKL